jgi:hypothetical protein
MCEDQLLRPCFRSDLRRHQRRRMQAPSREVFIPPRVGCLVNQDISIARQLDGAPAIDGVVQ